MKKILMLLLLVTGVVKAQITIDLDKGTKKVEAIVYKKNGSTVKGTLKLLSLQLLKKKVEIKGDKKYKIKNGEIDSIQVFNEKGELTPYTFYYKKRDVYIAKKKALKSYKHHMWMCKLLEGKANLYVTTSLFRLLDGKIDAIGSINEYFVQKQGETIPSTISHVQNSFSLSNKAYNKYFKAYAPIFFSDDSTIVSKINSGEYTRKDIEKIVEEYNK